MKAIMQAIFGGYSSRNWTVNGKSGVTNKVLLLGVGDEESSSREFKVDSKEDFTKLVRFQEYQFIMDIPEVIKDNFGNNKPVTCVGYLPFEKGAK